MVTASWNAIEIETLNDPSNIDWKIHHRSANVFKDYYNDVVTIKLARDSKQEQVYSGAYWRTADFRDGGTYQVCLGIALIYSLKFLNSKIYKKICMFLVMNHYFIKGLPSISSHENNFVY